jgi:3-dehydroquinate dehydratase-1
LPGRASKKRKTRAEAATTTAMMMKTTTTSLCTSIGADTVAELQRRACVALSLGSDMVELRIDKLKKGEWKKEGHEREGSERERDGMVEELCTAFSGSAERAVITVRSSGEGGGFHGSEASRLELISRLAHELRPAYVDIELETVRGNRRWADSLPGRVKTIVSWHDFVGTPPVDKLLRKSREQRDLGGVAKLVTTATSFEDNLIALAVCGEEPGRIVSFCMGGLGIISRVVSMRVGAPLAYASLPNEAVAPGQLSISMMRALRSMVA